MQVGHVDRGVDLSMHEEYVSSANVPAPIGCITRTISRITALVLLIVAVVAFGTTASQAQRPEGALGWEWDGTYYDTPTEACRAQWNWAGMNNGASRFIGAFPYTQNSRLCSWTSYQYLCRKETMTSGVLPCWTVLPSITTFRCETGYYSLGNGRCAKEPIREERSCSNNYGGARTLTVGNPILLASGAKTHEQIDFATADSRFNIRRSYRSSPQIAGNAAYLSPPRTSIGGWSFGYGLEFQLSEWIGNNGGSAGTVYAPDGTAYNFTRNGNSFTSETSYLNPKSDYTVDFVGPPPANWQTVRDTASQWRVVEPGGRVWLLQTMRRDNMSAGKFEIARPVHVTDRDGYRLNFSYGALNEITSVTDSFGRVFGISWQYFNVTALSGELNAAPVPEAIREITLPDGGKLRYGYDVTQGSGASAAHARRLETVERLDDAGAVVESTTYHYEDARFPTFLTGMTDGRNVRYGYYAYDGQGRAVSTEGPGGADKYTVEYPPASGGTLSRRVTGPLGKVATFHYEYSGGGVWSTRIGGVDGDASTNCPSSTRSYTYDANSFIETETDEEGRVTAYTRDPSGRPLTIVRGSGTPQATTATLTWNTSLDVVTQIIEPGVTTSYVWSASGTLTSRTQTDTTTHTSPYVTSGQARTWTYTYGTAGLLTSVNGPLSGTGDTVSYTYDMSGYVRTITNELAHVTTVDTVNGRGQPTLVTDPNGIKTALTYDAAGRLLTVTADSTGTPALTALTYDAIGQITRITRPGGAWESFAYDNARRLTTITNNAGETTNYLRDAMGGATSITRKKSDGTTTFTRTQTFDELGRLLRAIGASASTWRFGYDRTDNLVAVTDPRSNIYSYGFDALDRLISETNEDNDLVQVTRNGVDAIVSYADPRSITTSYVRNGFGEAIRTVSPDTGTTVYVRDPRGLITQRTDGRGVVANQTYDNAGRILTRSFPSATSLNVAWSYDSVAGGNKGKGRLTGISDASGTTAWNYDARGNVLSETRIIAGKTYVVSYAYDLADKVTKMTYPSGRIVDIARDATGRVGGVTTKRNASAASVVLASGVVYQPFGDLQSLTFGNGLSLWRTFTGDDELDQLLVIDVPTGVASMKRFHDRLDNGLNLTQIHAYDDVSPPPHQSFWYSPSRRLQNANGVWGDLTFYYGPGGNRTYEILTQGGTTSTKVTTYPGSSNRMLQVLTNGAVTRSFTHDNAGNLVADTRGSAAWTFTHNAAGRLSQARVGGSLRGTYTYDGLERLAIRAVTNTTPSGTTHLVYDTAGHLLAEANAVSGATIREYIWLEIEDRGADPGPTVRPANDNARTGGRLGSAETDNDPTSRAQLPSLNGPRRGLAPRAVPLAVVADVNTASPTTLFVHADHLDRPVRMTDAAQSLVWDAIYKPYGEVHSITGPASLNARFPGQWFQLETGLHHNWHRTYDPTTGRYLQPDPLGFIDGPSVYAYASSSPVMRADREGLTPLAIPSAICARYPALCSAVVAQVVQYCRDFIVGGGGNNGSGNPRAKCDDQKQRDDDICRSLPTKQSRGRCWASAAERYADCIGGYPPRPLRYI